MSLARAGPAPPEVLTCHGREVVTWLQAVCRCHYPFLIDDGRTAEAHAVAVHQMDLWERKEIMPVGLHKSVGKKGGMRGFCLAAGQAVLRLCRPRAATPRGPPAPPSLLCRRGGQHCPRTCRCPVALLLPLLLGWAVINLSVKLGASKSQALPQAPPISVLPVTSLTRDKILTTHFIWASNCLSTSGA